MRILARVIPVLHLVQRFYVGGAERQFIERLRAHPQGFEPVVGCLEISGGNLADFRALGLGEPHHLAGALLPTSGHALGTPCSRVDDRGSERPSSRRAGPFIDRVTSVTMRSQPKTDLARSPEALPGIIPGPSFSDDALLLTDAPTPGRPSSAEGADLETEVVTDWPRLVALEQEWQDLAAAASEPNPFYEPWMLLPALRAYGSEARLEVHVTWAARRGRRLLCGLFPIAWRRGRAEVWKHRSCYLATPLLRAGFGGAALRCFFDHLEPRTGLVRLDDVPGEGPFHLHLVDELNRRGWPSLVSRSYTRALFRPASSGDEFLERALNGKRRKELRRQRARLAELGHLELCELRPGEDPAPWIREFLSLEASGWKGAEGVAAALHPAERAYVEEMAARAHQRGRLMMLGLRLDGRPVALKYNLLAGDGAFAFKIAFDESFARYSPGVLLELDNIHRLHRMPGVRWMDSCAAPNRFMINHLWPERREMQTVFFSTGRALPSLLLALVPLFQFLRARARRRRRPS